jgi:hypothetical protein
MCLRVSYNYKKKLFFASLKSLKKGVGSGVGSGVRSGSGAGFGSLVRDTDPRIRIRTKMSRIPNTTRKET